MRAAITRRDYLQLRQLGGYKEALGAIVDSGESFLLLNKKPDFRDFRIDPRVRDGGVRMLQERQSGSPVYSQNLGLVDAEVYATDAGYQVFIVGETLTSYLGSSLLLDDCLEEIRSLQLLVESETFQREVGKYC